MLDSTVAYPEAMMWRNACGGAAPVPFIECAENLSMAIRFLERLDPATARHAIETLIRRHAVLGSCFHEEGGTLRRGRAPIGETLVQETDLRDLPYDARQQRAVDALNGDVAAPFSLASGPLVRGRVVTLADADHIVSLTVHHIVFDVWSAGIVARELSALCRRRAGDEGRLPPLAADYGRYIEWQRRQLSGARLETLRAFWMRRCERLSDVRLAPAVRDVISTRSRYVPFTIAPADAEALRLLSRAHQATVAATMLALLFLLMHASSEATDLSVGVPVSGRPTRELEGVVGLFMNVLPVRMDVSGDPRFPALLAEVRRAFNEAYEHRDYPYACLLDALGVNAAQAPLPFRVVLNVTRGRQSLPALPGVITNDMAVMREPPSFADLSLHVHDGETAMSGGFLGKADLFSDDEMRALADRFVRLVHLTLEHLDDPISRIVSGATRTCLA